MIISSIQQPSGAGIEDGPWKITRRQSGQMEVIGYISAANFDHTTSPPSWEEAFHAAADFPYFEPVAEVEWAIEVAPTTDLLPDTCKRYKLTGPPGFRPKKLNQPCASPGVRYHASGHYVVEVCCGNEKVTLQYTVTAVPGGWDEAVWAGHSTHLKWPAGSPRVTWTVKWAGAAAQIPPNHTSTSRKFTVRL